MSFSLRGLLPILRLASRLPNSRPVAAAALRARSSELAELRARLAEAEAKSLADAAARAVAEEARAAAEATSLADASARAAAEKARAAAEEARAAAEATSLADAAARAAEQKQHWFTRLEGMSSSAAAESASRADEARRGAPKPELASVDGVLGGFPSADGEAAAAAWVTACALTAGAWRPPSLKPAVAAAVLSENLNVHPVIHGVLSAIVGRNLRVWHNQETPDDAMAAAQSPHLWPDFVLTGARDAMPSTFGALVIVEVKLPGGIKAAAYQVRAAMRRRVAQLCREADACGEALEDAATVFGVGTDGAHVVLARMSSGAPRDGESFAGAIPCPVRETPPLPLFHLWDLRQPPPAKLAVGPPPAGFTALLRLCGEPSLLGGGGRALTSLHVRLQSGGGPFLASPRTLTITLTSRVGSGGTSDVYSCDNASGNRGGPLAVKVARFSTERVAREFFAERAALLALRGVAAAGLVPEVLAHGERADMAPRSSGVATLSWPVLLVSPLGEPLEAWVAKRARAAERAVVAMGGEAAAAAAAAAAARIAAADAVVHRVLDALAAAHAAGWVHCDVRPSNVVVAEPHGACLVDWGAALQLGAAFSDRGVPAFSDARVFSARGVTARPHVDALAALYMWLAVALGQRCTAPWLVPGDGDEPITSDESLFLARESWLRARHDDDCADGARVAAVVRAARSLERVDGRSSEDALALARRALRAVGAGADDEDAAAAHA
jgi:hypothetical protein